MIRISSVILGISGETGLDNTSCGSAKIKRKEHKIKNMNTKNIVLISFLTLTTIHSYGQIEQDSINTTQQTAKQVEIPIYQLFPTENHWAFIKLDTRNGKMWQVHFTISEDLFRGELILNTSSLVWKDEEINGRFTLYPTKNMYNFILLDQVTGKTYQVQWSNEENDRLIIPIY